jgi:GcrA cell cycle regulator
MSLHQPNRMNVMDMTNMAWTDERIEQLKTMWEKGLTASQIADELGGVSRNAVIGKAHRLGLKSRPSPVKAKPVPEPKAKQPAKPLAEPSIETPAVAAEEPAPAKPKKATPAIVAAEPAPPMPVVEPAGADAQEASEPVVAATPLAPRSDMPKIVSVGPGGFLRQGPGDQQAPIPPAPPRRLVPAKPSPEVADRTSLLELNERVCRWPINHPGEPDFHFCGAPVNPGFPYCIEHCGRAYQAQLPRGTRRAPPPMPFGGPRVR